MFDGLPANLQELAQVQEGILSADQLLGGGLSRGLLKSRVQQNRWQRLHRGVYATFSGQPSRLAILWAAVLSAGPGAMLSHNTAAELFRLSSPSEPIHITVPGDRRISVAPGIVVHYSARAARAVHPALAPPRTRIEETILDLAAAASSIDDACGWITRGLGSRLTTQDKLRLALEQRARMRWRPELAELLTSDSAGLHSVLERRYNRHVEKPHLLPARKRQTTITVGGHNEYRDVLYEEYATAVELDGNAYHSANTRWRDIRRDNLAAVDGIVTLRYGWLEVSHAPCQVASEVVRVLVNRGYRGARPCSSTCQVRYVVGLQRPSA